MSESESKAKAKAIELVDKFMPLALPISKGFIEPNQNVNLPNAKRCALICAEEILKLKAALEAQSDEIIIDDSHWQAVKREIQKL